MRALEHQAGQLVAEHIQGILALARLRADQQLLFMVALPGASPWPQVRQLLGQRHRAGVTVMGVVKYLVEGAAHEDCVRWLASTCTKKRKPKRSEMSALAWLMLSSSPDKPSSTYSALFVAYVHKVRITPQRLEYG